MKLRATVSVEINTSYSTVAFCSVLNLHANAHAPSTLGTAYVLKNRRLLSKIA